MRTPLALLSVALTGCVGYYLVGATAVDVTPTKGEAIYEVSKCTDVDKSTTINIPNPIRYVLSADSDGLALYESQFGQPSDRISNHWIESDGDHFFMYVRTSIGVHLVLPSDHTKSGLRYVLGLSKHYSHFDDGGVMKPKGDPAVTCEMTPTK